MSIKFLIFHDAEGREIPVRADTIDMVVHRSSNVSERGSILCLAGGKKEAVGETVDGVMQLLDSAGCIMIRAEDA